MTENASWVSRAEAALAGRGDADVQVIRGQRPPLFEGEGNDALVAPLIAGFLWAAAIFLETKSGATDPVALLLRWLALGVTVRAARLAWLMAQRVRLWFSAPRYALAIVDEGLLLRTPSHDTPIARTDVVGVREPGDWRTRSGRRYQDVYVVTRPFAGRLHLALPPVFCETPGLLAEQLMRWLGPPAELPESFPEPDPLPSKLYEAAARAEAPAGVIGIPHGNAWLARGPYFTALLGVVLAERWLQLEPAARTRLGLVPLALVFTCVVAVPLIWYRITKRLLAPRYGLSLVLTPAEMLMRTGAGIHRVPWRSLKRVDIQAHRGWSILSGMRAERQLIVERTKDPEIRYDEVFLGLPAEVVAGLADAYRSGRLP